ncbi:hypothetical protein BN59_01009 [Legionella massiliensis]|uniref:Secreted protein n=1 Tax=Legionella massiliensis TaxID=1034943 RepID=A0A078KY87_9GAMM|nr:hypothetical protein [Legionella massiliensis]CDZ76734.1 hypothetical protein BN59_01009 [Legionella massiliensis]CEE12472.1 hypothetical protein BN1094_01009 [Legionella massiliensis]
MLTVNRFTKRLLILSLPFMSLAYQPCALAHGGHAHPAHSMQATPATIQLSLQRIVDQGNKKIVFIKLSDIKTHKPISLADLTEVHTQKIHMLVIDDNLNDYSHVHPMPTHEPGVYSFNWHPVKKDANYRIWADLVPVKTKQQEYVITDLHRAKSSLTEIVPKIRMESVVDGYKFKLSFDQAQLQKGKAVMGKIDISDSQGKPVHYLEPVMGAYAHIVGFSDDFNSVVHIHPMGTEPQKSADRGGPELDFHIEPQKTGFIKLFAQVKIKGKELFVPFGVVVNKSEA